MLTSCRGYRSGEIDYLFYFWFLKKAIANLILGVGSINPLLKPNNGSKLSADVLRVVNKFIDENFQPSYATVQCGSLASKVN